MLSSENSYSLDLYREFLQFVLPWFVSFFDDSVSYCIAAKALERVIKRLGSINVMMRVKENG